MHTLWPYAYVFLLLLGLKHSEPRIVRRTVVSATRCDLINKLFSGNMKAVMSPRIFERGAGPKTGPTQPTPKIKNSPDLVHYFSKGPILHIKNCIPVKKVAKSKIIGGGGPDGPPHFSRLGGPLPGLYGGDAHAWKEGLSVNHPQIRTNRINYSDMIFAKCTLVSCKFDRPVILKMYLYYVRVVHHWCTSVHHCCNIRMTYKMRVWSALNFIVIVHIKANNLG